MSPLTPNIIIRAKCLFKSPSRVRVCHFCFVATVTKLENASMPWRACGRNVCRRNYDFPFKQTLADRIKATHTHVHAIQCKYLTFFLPCRACEGSNAIRTHRNTTIQRCYWAWTFFASLHSFVRFFVPFSTLFVSFSFSLRPFLCPSRPTLGVRVLCLLFELSPFSPRFPNVFFCWWNIHSHLSRHTASARVSRSRPSVSNFKMNRLKSNRKVRLLNYSPEHFSHPRSPLKG